jgi:hypothetical protein
VRGGRLSGSARADPCGCKKAGPAGSWLRPVAKVIENKKPSEPAKSGLQSGAAPTFKARFIFDLSEREHCDVPVGTA